MSVPKFMESGKIACPMCGQYAHSETRPTANPFCWYIVQRDITDEYTTVYNEQEESPGPGWKPLYAAPQALAYTTPNEETGVVSGSTPAVAAPVISPDKQERFRLVTTTWDDEGFVSGVLYDEERKDSVVILRYTPSARGDMLEEAAKICEQMRPIVGITGRPFEAEPLYSEHHVATVQRDTLDNAARLIRSLKQTSYVGEKK